MCQCFKVGSLSNHMAASKASCITALTGRNSHSVFWLPTPFLFPYPFLLFSYCYWPRSILPFRTVRQATERLKFAIKGGFIPKAAKWGDRTTILKAAFESGGVWIFTGWWIKKKVVWDMGSTGKGDRDKDAVILVLHRHAQRLPWALMHPQLEGQWSHPVLTSSVPTRHSLKHLRQASIV